MGTEGNREPCYFEEGGDKGYLSCAVATSHLLLVLNEICYKHRSHTGFRRLSMKKKKKKNVKHLINNISLITRCKYMRNENIWGVLGYRGCYQIDFPCLFLFFNVATWNFKIPCRLHYISSGQCRFTSTLHGRIMAHAYFPVLSIFFKLEI